MAIHYGSVDGICYPMQVTFKLTKPTTIKIDHGCKYGKEVVTIPGKKIYTQKGTDVGARKGVFRDNMSRAISSEIIAENPIKNVIDIHKRMASIKLNNCVEFNKKNKRGYE